MQKSKTGWKTNSQRFNSQKRGAFFVRDFWGNRENPHPLQKVVNRYSVLSVRIDEAGIKSSIRVKILFNINGERNVCQTFIFFSTGFKKLVQFTSLVYTNVSPRNKKNIIQSELLLKAYKSGKNDLLQLFQIIKRIVLTFPRFIEEQHFLHLHFHCGENNAKSYPFQILHSNSIASC